MKIPVEQEDAREEGLHKIPTLHALGGRHIDFADVFKVAVRFCVDSYTAVADVVVVAVCTLVLMLLVPLQ